MVRRLANAAAQGTADRSEDVAARNFLDRLKTETTPEHRALEALVPLMSPRATAADLCHYFEVAAAYHRQAEHQIDVRWPGLFATWGYRRRAPLYDALFQALADAEGVVPLVPESASVVCAPRETLEQVLGWLYVFEGSALGGAVIAQHLMAGFPDHETPIRACFLPYGSQPRGHWRDFQGRLCEFVASKPARERAVIDAASAAFANYANWIRARLPVN